MTIWGTYVFAKPLGRCIQVLRALQAPENIPAMNNLIQTLDEYLRATDSKTHDVFCKAISQPANTEPGLYGNALTDEEILTLLRTTCSEQNSSSQTDLKNFARAIEARVRMTNKQCGDLVAPRPT